MSDTKIDITGVQPNQVKAAGWATEATLQSLVASNTSIQALLNLVAKTSKRIDAADIANANKGIIQAVKQSTSDENKHNKDNAVQNRTLFNSLGQRLGSLGKEFGTGLKNISAGIAKFNIPDGGNILSPVQGALNSYSWSLKDSTGVLAKFTIGLTTAVNVIVPIIDRLSEMNDVMRTIYASGTRVTGGLEGLISGAQAAGLSTKEFAEILTKNANVTVGLGTRRTTDLMKMFASATRYGSEMIMTNKESQEAFVDIISSMQSLGMMRNMSDTQIIDSSRNYLTRLNQLSEATGRNRNELLKGTKEAMQQPHVWAALRMLPKEMQENFRATAASLQANFGQEQGKRLMDEIARYTMGGAGMMSDDFKLLMSMTSDGIGASLQKISELGSSGRDATGAIEELVVQINELDPNKIASLSRAQKDSLLRTLESLTTESAKPFAKIMEDLRDPEGAAQRKKDREALLKSEQARTEIFNKFKAASNNVSQTFEKMTARLMPVATILLDKIADGLNWFVSALDTVSAKLTSVFKLIGLSDEGAAGAASSVTTVAAAVLAFMLSARVISMIRGTVGLAFGGGPSKPTGGGRGMLSRAVSNTGMLLGAGVGIIGLIDSARSLYSGLSDISRREQAGEIKPEDARQERSNVIKAVTIEAAVSALLASGALFKVAGGVMRWMGAAGAGLMSRTMGVLSKLPGASILGRIATRAAPAAVGGVAVDAVQGATSAAAGASGKMGGVLSRFGKMIGDTIVGISQIIKDVSQNLGSAIASLSKGIGSAIGDLGKGIGSAIGDLGTGLGTAINAIIKGLGRGVGTALEAILSGLAAGLKAFANPQILLGSAILSGSIALIGAGVAGAAWIMGKALPTLAEGLKSFADIDGEALWQTGKGMLSLGAGLVAMTAGEIVNGIGSLVSGLLNLFTEDPISKLKRFAEIGEPLKTAADSMKAFADVMPAAVQTLNSLNISRQAARVLDQFKDLFGSGWFTSKITEADLQSGIFVILKKFAQEQLNVQAGSDAIQLLSNINISNSVISSLSKLQDLFKTGLFSSSIKESDLNSGMFVIFKKFSDQKDIIDRAVDAINRLTQIDLSGFIKIKELLSLSQTLNANSITNLSSLISSPQFVQSLQNLSSAIVLSPKTPTTTITGPTTGGATVETVPTPTTPATNIEEITLNYYEKSLRNAVITQDLLKELLEVLHDSKESNERGLSNVEGAVEKISGLVG